MLPCRSKLKDTLSSFETTNDRCELVATACLNRRQPPVTICNRL
jgi:hypothetical protein